MVHTKFQRISLLIIALLLIPLCPTNLSVGRSSVSEPRLDKGEISDIHYILEDNFTYHYNGIPYFIKIARNGSQFVVGAEDHYDKGELFLFNMSGRMIKKVPSDYIADISFSPDGSLLAVASTENTITIRNSSTLKVQRTLVNYAPVHCIDFSPDGNRIISANRNGYVTIWNVTDGEGIHNIETSYQNIFSVKYSGDGKKFCFTSEPFVVEIRDSLTSEFIGNVSIENVSQYISQISFLDFSHDGKYIIAGGGDGFAPGTQNFFLIDVETLSIKYRVVLEVSAGDYFSLNFGSSDRFWIISGPSVAIFDTLTGNEIQQTTEFGSWYNDISVDENYIVSLNYTFDITLWSRDSDWDGIGNIKDDFPADTAASIDTDGDGFPDEWNKGCTEKNSTTGLKLDDFPAEPSQWNDTDGDEWGDNYANLTWAEGRAVGIFIPNAYRPDRFPLDPTQWNDTDGDGYGDNYSGSDPDVFPEDPFEWNDTDGDGLGDNSDTDIDGDEWNNSIELKTGTDPYDPLSFPDDLDGDRIPDVFDDDIDGDGWNNTIETELDTDPYDNSLFPSDTDRDGIPDKLDEDDDNDSYSDVVEIRWETDPMDNKSYPQRPVWLEIPIVEFGGCIFSSSFDLSEYISDDDTSIENMVFSVMCYNGSYINVTVSGTILNIEQINQSRSDVWIRAFDGLHHADTNITVIADGTGAPLPDHDEDGIPDVEDDDIDNDGFNNYVEGLCGTDPYDNLSFPPDMDEDGLPDSLDPDRDGDEVKNEDDFYPDHPGKWEEKGEDKKGNSAWFWVVGIVFLLVLLGIVGRLLLVRRKGGGGEGEKESKQ